MKKFALVALAGAMALPALPALAHHSASMFDSAKTVTLKGVVKEFQYTNPHSWLLIDVMGPSNHVTTWSFEAEGPGMLLRAGIKKSDFTPGTQVTVTGHPMRNGLPAATWMKAVRADGKVFNPSPRRHAASSKDSASTKG